jgi:hypothetical protein
VARFHPSQAPQPEIRVPKKTLTKPAEKLDFQIEFCRDDLLDQEPFQGTKVFATELTAELVHLHRGRPAV